MLLAADCVILYSGLLHDSTLDSGRAPNLGLLTTFAFFCCLYYCVQTCFHCISAELLAQITTHILYIGGSKYNDSLTRG